MSRNFNIGSQKKVLFFFDMIFSPKIAKIEPFILTSSILIFLKYRFCIESSKFGFYIKFWSRNMYNEGYIITVQNNQILSPNVTNILKCVVERLRVKVNITKSIFFLMESPISFLGSVNNLEISLLQ